MTYVSEVRSNVKGRVDATLGPKTLIVGPNMVGKSAIVNSVELALCGSATDIVGRAVVKDAKQLATLAPLGEDLWAEVRVGEGTVAGKLKGKGWIWDRQPSGLYDPQEVFPLHAVRAALLGTVETARKFFLRYASGNAAVEDVEARIPPALRELFDAATPEGEHSDAASLLLSALESAKERLRALRSEVRTREAIVEESGAGLPPPPAAQALREASAAVEAARKRLEEMLRASNPQVHALRTGLEQRLERARTRKQALEASLQEVADALRGFPDGAYQAEAIEELQRAHLFILKHALEMGLKACPTCRQGVDSALWEERVASVTRKQEERAEQNASYGRVVAEYKSLQHDLGIADADIGSLEAQLVALPGVVATIDASMLEEARATLDTATQRYTDMLLLAERWANVQRTQNRAVARQKEAADWELLIDTLKSAIGSLLDAGVEAFTARVQNFLPSSMHFRLVLHEDDREVCRFGFVRPGARGGGHDGEEQFVTALSGVEWATLTAALAAAAAADEGLHIVVLEDRSWDPNTLSAVLGALGSCSMQVIVATTTRPRTVPDGWTVIDTWAKLPAEDAAGAEDAGGTPSAPSASYIAKGTCRHGVQEGNYCDDCGTEARVPKRRGRQKKAAGEKSTAGVAAVAATTKPITDDFLE